ncbi:unnamed protein product [Pleuronectes platessa]|uniref:Uncharacterized protein n=1 Tax=Pleuronectes platessa TaxID=8262 RepID=A0A9N7ZEP2_PLEPL|nr:unnamed protein product [Pleuronectes platessa]
MGGHSGFSILPKDTLACRLVGLVIELPTVRLEDDQSTPQPQPPTPRPSAEWGISWWIRVLSPDNRGGSQRILKNGATYRKKYEGLGHSRRHAPLPWSGLLSVRLNRVAKGGGDSWQGRCVRSTCGQRRSGISTLLHGSSRNAASTPPVASMGQGSCHSTKGKNRYRMLREAVTICLGVLPRAEPFRCCPPAQTLLPEPPSSVCEQG